MNTYDLADLVDDLATTYDITPTAAREAAQTFIGQLIEIDGHEAVWAEEDTETLTASAAADVREAMTAHAGQASSGTQEQDLAELVAELQRAEHEVSNVRADRDEAIRAALASGMTYKDVQTITGLSRGMVDGIRRGLTRLG